MRRAGETAVVDPGDGAPALAEAERRGWTIGQVWNTHWHPDHTGGNLAVKQATGCLVLRPGNRDYRRASTSSWAKATSCGWATRSAG